MQDYRSIKYNIRHNLANTNNGFYHRKQLI